MWRLRNIFARVSKGSDGQVVVLAMIVTFIAGILVTISVWLPGIRVMATSLTLVLLLGMQLLLIFQLGRVRAKANDIQYSIGLEHGLLRGSLLLHNYYYDGAAGTPSLQIYILKIISFLRPEKILELGSGQTTRLLSACSRADDNIHVTTLEQNKWWVDKLSTEVSHERHQFLHCPTELRIYRCSASKLRFQCEGYIMPPSVLEHKYNFILIDGPDDGKPGTDFTPYARAGILWHIPQLLADHFVVMFDDADLYKHQMAINVFKSELTSCKIHYVSFRVHGVKDQEIICSPEYKFLRSV